MTTQSAEVDQVAELVKAHRLQLDELLRAHTQRLEAAQAEFDGLVVQANAQLQNLIAGAQQPEEKPEPPQSVWHEGHLVLNRSAAQVFEDLFSSLSDVLQEVQALVSTRPK